MVDQVEVEQKEPGKNPPGTPLIPTGPKRCALHELHCAGPSKARCEEDRKALPKLYSDPLAEGRALLTHGA